MSKFFPFRGYRYSQKVGDLKQIVTQPYDKITPEMRSEYVRRSPYNVAHVISNPDYRQAGESFQRWIEEGVLIQDTAPSVYPYRQQFTVDGQSRQRLGLIGLVSLEDAEAEVKGHETVLQAPLEDRLQLIRQTESNDGLIFSLFSDKTQRVDRILEKSCRLQPPVADLVDDYGTRHTVWQLHQPELVRELSALLGRQTFYIADGHHRFETAVRFARECREKGWTSAAVESFDKRMMALFNMDSEGINILPTHRGIRGLPKFDADRFLKDLKEHFEVSPVDTEQRAVEALTGLARGLVAVLGQPPAYFVLQPGPQLPPALEEIQGPARELDVNLLHRGILQPILGIGEAEVASQQFVDYFRSREELLKGVVEGRYQLGFILNPTRLDQVKAISERGERMPQKSTDFYPKLLTGLVFMKMAIKKPVISSTRTA